MVLSSVLARSCPGNGREVRKFLWKDDSLVGACWYVLYYSRVRVSLRARCGRVGGFSLSAFETAIEVSWSTKLVRTKLSLRFLGEERKGETKGTGSLVGVFWLLPFPAAGAPVPMAMVVEVMVLGDSSGGIGPGRWISLVVPVTLTIPAKMVFCELRRGSDVGRGVASLGVLGFDVERLISGSWCK